MTFIFLCALIFCLCIDRSINTDECLITQNYFSHHLATKTSYFFILNNNDSVIRYDSCEPKKIWTVIRHGSRFPGKKVIRNMNEKLPKLRDNIIENHDKKFGKLCPATLLNLTSWNTQLYLDDNKRLVNEGEDEMTELAQRFQKRFPELLMANYSNSTYKFRFTKTQRTDASKKYFTIGLFGRETAKYVWCPEPLEKDPVLRFYKLCSKWKKEVDGNPDSLLERKLFEESDFMNAVVRNVSNRLGFSYELPLEDIKLMYIICGFESAWSSYHTSPWCGVFTEYELEILEYAEDLEYYWIDGYGYEINYEQACPIMEDMIKHLTWEDGPQSTFYFTHSGTILKFLSHLGLYKDAHTLTHKTFDKKRLWRVGRIDAFASNLAFILYQCEDGPKLLTLHQERPVVLPGCPEELCPLEVIIENYRNSFYNCKFDDLCREVSIHRSEL